MPLVVIVPVKSFRSGKQRLHDTLDDRTRQRLGVALAHHVASTVESARQVPLIVTADPEVAEWATSTGFPTLADPGDGLNAAASAGVEWAGHTDSAWLVLHSDLPLLTANDVEALTAPIDNGSAVLAPSSDGGTSAIGSRGHFTFAYGVASFHRHLTRLDRPAVVVRRGLALDIDSPADFGAATASDAGRWLADAMR
jgi:2-phospho-L-lactate guanylyltransferase